MYKYGRRGAVKAVRRGVGRHGGSKVERAYRDRRKLAHLGRLHLLVRLCRGRLRRDWVRGWGALLLRRLVIDSVLCVARANTSGGPPQTLFVCSRSALPVGEAGAPFAFKVVPHPMW